ncbi:MAG TPA: hypothetical protein VKD22_09810 [Ramlibacter sp.]|nr:hypothetical protein [Ramlibacter sp.]
MVNGPGGATAALLMRPRDGARPAARVWPALAMLLLLALAGCDQFSADRVAQTCVREAMKAGEPYGNEAERQRTEAQLRQYCKAAAESN